MTNNRTSEALKIMVNHFNKPFKNDDLYWEMVAIHHKYKKMEEALRTVGETCNNPGMEDPFKNNWEWFYKTEEALSFDPLSES